MCDHRRVEGRCRFVGDEARCPLTVFCGGFLHCLKDGGNLVDPVRGVNRDRIDEGEARRGFAIAQSEVEN
jgi:hypothetical protein